MELSEAEEVEVGMAEGNLFPSKADMANQNNLLFGDQLNLWIKLEKLLVNYLNY